MTPGDLKDRVRAAALEHGFDVCRFTSARPDPADKVGLHAFLAAGAGGGMTWLNDPGGRRGDPSRLLPGAKSVIVLGVNYAPDGDPLKSLAQRSMATISVYARGRDYHDVIKKRLKTMARAVNQLSGETDTRVYVDTGPVMEKPLAARAGLGWQGKHTNLVSRRFGSWLFLSEIVTTLDLPPDPPEADHCGSCNACREACPTDALDGAAYQIRADRCVSYLTIEHKGDIGEDLMALMGNRVYGCDDCLGVCPWNKFARPSQEPAFKAPADRRNLSLTKLARLDDAAFRALFSKSPVKRTGRDRMLRNVAAAIGNSGDASLLETARKLARDASPMVARAGAWAARRLTEKEADRS